MRTMLSGLTACHTADLVSPLKDPMAVQTIYHSKQILQSIVIRTAIVHLLPPQLQQKPV